MELSIFDLHCDTAYEMYINKTHFASNEHHISLERMNGYKHYVQVFAICCPYKLNNRDGYLFWKNAYDYLNSELDSHRDIIIKARRGCECQFGYEKSKPVIFFAIEDARIVDDDITRLDEFYDAGVRFITLTWSGNTIIGGSHNTENGLTDFGKNVVERCFNLGIIPDISHASEKTADDVASLSVEFNKPFVATHSNSYSVYPHSRNLRDCHFTAIKESGGLVGLSMCRSHLDNVKLKTVNLMSLIPHIEHYLSLGGEDILTLGCDFDGTDLPFGIENCSDLYKLADKLSEMNYSDEIINKIFYKNGKNFVEQNLI